MKTIQIEIPDGQQIDFDTKSGVVKFKPLSPRPVRERIKTIDDVLIDNGILPNSFERWSEGMSKDEVSYRIIKLLAKSLNEGWQPDWNNSKEYKYYAWFEMGGPSGFRFFGFDCWSSASDVGSRLCFKSRELAEYAGKQFTEVYKQFMVI